VPSRYTRVIGERVGAVLTNENDSSFYSAKHNNDCG